MVADSSPFISLRLSAFGIPLGFVLKTQLEKPVSIEDNDKLTKQACIAYQEPAILVLEFRLIRLDTGFPVRRTS